MNRSGLSFVIVILCTLCPAGEAGSQTVLDRVVAVVGREYILRSDLDAQTEFYAFGNKMDPSMPGLKEQVLDAMINQKLILTRAFEDTTIVVRDEDVAAQLEALIAQRIQQAGSEKKLEELYGMPISKMKREFRDDTRHQLMIQQLQQNKFADVQSSKRGVEEFFNVFKDSLPLVPEELEIYHIFRLPRISAAARNIAMGKALRILDSIKGGADLGDFARRYSDDPGTRSFGGDLGFARRGQFFKEFEEAIFALKENQLANVVETPIGLHIMQLLERRGESVHARHILFKIARDSSEAESTRVFLSSLRDSALHGESFSDLAKRHSQDKESAPVGGLLGRFSINQFDKSLVDVVKTMNESEISEPVEIEYATSKGYHIIYLKKRIPEHRMNLRDDWKRLEQMATTNKRNNDYQEWIKELRTEIYWESRL